MECRERRSIPRRSPSVLAGAVLSSGTHYRLPSYRRRCPQPVVTAQSAPIPRWTVTGGGRGLSGNRNRAERHGDYLESVTGAGRVGRGRGNYSQGNDEVGKLGHVRVGHVDARMHGDSDDVRVVGVDVSAPICRGEARAGQPQHDCGGLRVPAAGGRGQEAGNKPALTLLDARIFCGEVLALDL